MLWGMLSYSFAVLGVVSGLAIKMSLLYRDRSILKNELAEAEHREVENRKIAKEAEEMANRYKKEIEILYDETNNNDLSADNVAFRLGKLLSSKM
jgi:beta-lactamase regulating signal transducer with metallopeptidase domain